jgi:integrase
MRRLSLPKSAEREPPDLRELRRLLEASQKVPHRDFLAVPVALAISCGLRRGEVLGLKWADIDFEKSELRVRHSLEEVKDTLRLKTPKTPRSRRTIALSPDVVDALRHHRVRQAEWSLQCGAGYDREADLVNAGLDGAPWRPTTFTDVYAKFARSLGVKGTFHDLRHGHASGLIAAGVDARAVADRLGHSSPAFTMSRYVHAASDASRRAAATFEDVLRGANREPTNDPTRRAG